MPEPTPEEVAAEEARLQAEHDAAEAQAKADAEQITAEEAEAEKAFAAGFEHTEYVESKKEDANPPEATNEGVENPDATQSPEQKRDEAKPEQASITKDQADKLLGLLTQHQEFKGSVEKQFGTAFGKMGGLERLLKEMQASKSAGQPVKLSKDDLKELKDAGFEDLIDKLIPGLERALTKVNVAPAAAPTFDEAAVQKVLAEDRLRQTAQLQQQCVADLNEMVPEWRSIVGDPNGPQTDWRKWLAKQPAHYKKRIENSWIGSEVAESIFRYQSDVAKATDEAAKAKAKKDNPESESRKERLAEAVTKRSSPARETQKSDDEMFAEGFKSGPAGALMNK